MVLERAIADRIRVGGTAWLCVDPVEYHGPHLSLHNDPLICAGLTREVAAALGDDDPAVAVLRAGVDPVPGPGSVHVPYSKLVPQVRALAREVADAGATRVVVFTFHGAPLHDLALWQAVRWLRAQGLTACAPLNTLLQRLVTGDVDDVLPAWHSIANPADRDALLANPQADFHAGFFETSMALRYAPDTVSPGHRDLPACPAWPLDRRLARAAAVARKLGRESLARELDFASLGAGWYRLRPFPGYTGRPRAASVEAGEIFRSVLVDGFADEVRSVFDGGEPAPPPLRWLRRATLGGRLFREHVPLNQVGLPA
jgi:creatinine amidohydrolase